MGVILRVNRSYEKLPKFEEKRNIFNPDVEEFTVNLGNSFSSACFTVEVAKTKHVNIICWIQFYASVFPVTMSGIIVPKQISKTYVHSTTNIHILLKKQLINSRERSNFVLVKY